MKNVILAGMLAALIGTAAAAQENRGAAIEQVIRDQISAFLADDMSRAFDFASPAIRRIFQSPENFGNMVREGYPMVWRPSSVEFLGLREEGGRLVQRLMVEGPDGRRYLLDYDMIPLGEGWKINGVSVLPAQGV